MLKKTNIETQLIKLRNNRIGKDAIMEVVQRIFSENEAVREKIFSNLKEVPSDIENDFKINLLDSECIYHITDIKQLCITYRLRFLDSHFFKGAIPEEAISKIRELENEHKTSIKNFKIIAPSKLLKLENADDPLLFAPIAKDYFYLIHKWGNDLHPLRKLLMWPYKSFENLIFTTLVFSLLLTAVTPMGLFTKHATMQEYVLMFLFMFKAVGGIVLFYGFAKGKNFNTAIWDSKFYNT